MSLPHEAPQPSSEESPRSAPSTDQNSLSPEQLVEAKEYNRQALRLSLVDMALDLVFLSLLVIFVAKPLDAWLAGFSWLAGDDLLPRLMRLAVFFLICMALHYAVSFALSFYRSYVLEHRFGLSNQTLARWFSQYAKAMSLMTVANLVMFLGLYVILWLTGGWWWLVAAAAAFAVSVLIGYIAPVLILPLFIKYEPLNDESLQRELSQLAEGTGLTIEGTYRLNMSADTKKANAMLAGLGRTRRVLLGDTLLESFTQDEIKVVMAHEIGHHVYKHIYKMLLLSIPYSLLTFWLFNLLLAWWIGPGYNPSQMPVYAVAMFMLAAFLFGTLTGPLQAGLMRHFERQCDWYALERTHLPEAYRSAFTKLAKLNKADPDPHWLEVLLFDDHPPIAERLAMAERFASAN
jgi:STE24 endopeptidase